MDVGKKFNELLADEAFQSELMLFDSLDEADRKAFIRRYAVSKEEFIKAKTIVDGLSFKGINFSEDELDYLWKRLGIENPVVPHNQGLQVRKMVTWFNKIAAVLMIPLLITSIWFFNKTQKLESFKKDEIDRLTEVYNTVSAPVGGKTKAVLPDGSEVWLNSGSSVQYPILGKPAYREVKLSGEGFFKVVKNPDQPMLVMTSGIQVKVYGTTFNLSAYEDDPYIQAALIEGEIAIAKLNEKGTPVTSEYKMKPGEIGKLDKQKNTVTVARTDNMEVFTGWVNGRYVFRNKPFKEILKRLERLHNVTFVLEDETIGDDHFDATFEDQNIDRIMEIFAVSLPITWRSVQAVQNNDNTYSTKNIIISGEKTKELP